MAKQKKELLHYWACVLEQKFKNEQYTTGLNEFYALYANMKKAEEKLCVSDLAGALCALANEGAEYRAQIEDAKKAFNELCIFVVKNIYSEITELQNSVYAESEPPKTADVG